MFPTVFVYFGCIVNTANNESNKPVDDHNPLSLPPLDHCEPLIAPHIDYSIISEIEKKKLMESCMFVSCFTPFDDIYSSV